MIPLFGIFGVCPCCGRADKLRFVDSLSPAPLVVLLLCANCGYEVLGSSNTSPELAREDAANSHGAAARA